MRQLLLSTLMLSMTIACGSPEVNRKHIEETVNQSAAATSDSAFHSLTGWQKTVNFYVASEAPDDVVEASQNSAESWNDAVGQVVLKFVGIAETSRGQDLYASLDDDLTFVYYEPNWNETTSKSSTTLATTVWENADRTDKIVKGDIILNAETYHFMDATKRKPRGVSDSEVVDAETVLLHEFGHLLGLDHVAEESDPDSIMHAKTFIGPNLTFRTLSDDDVGHIKQLYPEQ